MTELPHNEFYPDYVVTPGETLQETLETRGMSQAELAERMGRPKKTINGIIKGKVAITPETALQLERVLGVPAGFWNNLQRQYDETLARLTEDERMRLHTSWVTKFPLAQMREYGWITCFDDPVSQLDAMLRFFGIASPEQWASVWDTVVVSFRRSQVHESTAEALSVWLRQGELQAQQIACGSFAASGFKDVLQQARALTTQPIDRAWPKVVELCSAVGVAVVGVRELVGAPVSGAARWLSPTKAMIQLSLRYKTDDQLWFSFFHEAEHILLHSKRETFIDYDNPGSAKQQDDEADAHAAEFLIPQAALRRFLKSNKPPYISRAAVQEFAAGLEIAPGIVVGRLQHDDIVPKKNLNDLKMKLTWSDPVEHDQ